MWGDYRIDSQVNLRNIVLVLPPAPAARVLVGLALAALSALSAAAFLLTTVFAPPGGDEVVPLLSRCRELGGRLRLGGGIWGGLGIEEGQYVQLRIKVSSD